MTKLKNKTRQTKNRNGNVDIYSRFAKVIISKMEEMKKSEWKKPWFNPRSSNFYPANINGRKYKSGNAFLLLLIADFHGYKTPYFMTFKQAQEMGLRIKKGESSSPVYVKKLLAYNKDNNNKIDFDDFRQLSKEKKEDYILRAFFRAYNVFNIDQTNMEEIAPDLYKSHCDSFVADMPDVADVINNDILDNMLDNYKWVCDIDLRSINKAFFAPGKDIIVCPKKEQFFNQHNFYGTLLHEMIHSTGVESRLNRDLSGFFGSPEYAREELIAEMGAAFLGVQFGVYPEPQENSIAYLNSWIEKLKKDPNVIFNLMDDLMKAVNYTTEVLGFSEEEIKDVV